MTQPFNGFERRSYAFFELRRLILKIDLVEMND